MRARPAAMAVLVAVVVTGCGASESTSSATDAAEPVALRLGYFPNVTHAPALVGIEEELFTDALGTGVDLTAQAFNAGPDVIEAIFNGALDASYIGPNPAINGFTRSDGQALRIVAGATSGGAALVVTEEIGGPEDLRGTTLATPQLGNTQDVALRAWLADQGYSTDLEGGGDVSIAPQANGQALEAFIAGEIDGAWVPEPWATRMVREGGGRVLVDERDLWPDGEFVTTHLIVATEFLESHPGVVRDLLAGHLAAVDYLNENPEESQRIVTEALVELTGAEVPEGTLAAAWENLTFTVDPIAESLAESAADAVSLGLLEDGDIEGIYDLNLINEVLGEAGRPELVTP